MNEIDAFARRYASKPVGESNASGSEPSGACGAGPSAETDAGNLSPQDDEPGTSDNSEYIEHIVCKSDTLAGLAIKHNVGVSDIKRANGLMSESMMWSRTKLLIPKAPLPLSDEAVMKYAAMVTSGGPGGAFGRGSLGSSALDQLRSYYELAPEPSYTVCTDAPRMRSNPDAPGDVEMMVRSPTGDTPVADTDRWVDDRVQRLRKRGDFDATETSTSGSPRASSSSCLPANCMPGQAEAAPVSQVLQSMRGVLLDTFGDIMEKPARSRPANPGSGPRAGSSRPASSRPASASVGPSGVPGGRQSPGKPKPSPVRETLFQKLQRVSSQPALAQGGPSLTAIGDGLLRGGRDPLSANGSLPLPPRSAPPSNKGKAD